MNVKSNGLKLLVFLRIIIISTLVKSFLYRSRQNFISKSLQMMSSAPSTSTTLTIASGLDLDRLCQQSNLLITLGPTISKRLHDSPFVIVKESLELHKGVVQTTSRAKRKLPRPPTSYPIRNISVSEVKHCTWMEISEDWDVEDVQNLPYYKKQVFEVFSKLLQAEPEQIVILDDTVNLLPAKVLFLLTFLCHFDHKNSNLVPNESLRVIDGHGEIRIEFSLQRWREGMSPGNGYGSLEGSALDQRISELLNNLFDILQWKDSFYEAVMVLVRRIAFSHIKDRKRSRNMVSISSTLLTVDAVRDKMKSRTDILRRVKEKPSREEGWTVNEFFSGIGGMRLALPERIEDIPIRKIRAFDCSAVPNEVYDHNFHSNGRQGKRSKEVECGVDDISDSTLHNILVQGLKVDDVDGKADIWTMSPPCQPYTTTRGARRLDHLDNRSRGLCHLISLLLQMKHLPRYIVVENVKGFVDSVMHGYWLDCMKTCGYAGEEFVLSPDQVAALPNSRSRYYFVGSLRDTMQEGIESTVVCSSKGIIQEAKRSHQENDGIRNSSTQLLEKIAEAEEKQCSSMEEGVEESDDGKDYRGDEFDVFDVKTEQIDDSSALHNGAEQSLKIKYILPLSIPRVNEHIVTLGSLLSLPEASFDVSHRAQLIVPEHILRQSWAVKSLSIVKKSDRLTYCFTKGYGKIFDNSAGSLLYDPLDGTGNDTSEIDRSNLAQYYGSIRLFHPKELLRLFGFPHSFSFPAHMTMRQQFNCIGNSVNVQVVSNVMQYLFSSNS